MFGKENRFEQVNDTKQDKQEVVVEPKPVRHTANEAYQMGESARDDLREELLNQIYEEINHAITRGRTLLKLTTLYNKYRSVISVVADELKANHYDVTYSVEDGEVSFADRGKIEIDNKRLVIFVDWTPKEGER